MASGNDEADFVLRLVNEVSKEAQAAKRDLEAVRQVMEKTGATEGEARSAMKSLAAAEKEAADAAKKLGAEQKKAAEEGAKKHADALTKVGEASSKANAQLVEFAASTVVALGAVVVGLVAAAEQYALKAGEFQDKTLKAFEILDGTKQSADATLRELREGASSLGLPTEAITKYYKELRTAGFAAEEAKTILSAGLDIAAVGDEAQGNAFVKAIESLRVKGVTGTEALESLKEAGIGDPDAFFKALAQQEGATKGLDKAHLEAMLKAGQIDSGTGINAMLDVIRSKYDKGGALGSAAKEMAEGSVSAQLQGLKNDVEGIFADASVKGPLLEMLKSLRELLGADTESGQKIRETLGRAFQDVANILSKLDAKTIEKLLNVSIDLAGAAIDVAEAFGGAFWKSLKKAMEPFAKLTDGSEASKLSLKTLAVVVDVAAEALGFLAGEMIGTFTEGVAGILNLPSRLEGLYEGFKDVFDRIPHSWDELAEWWDELSLEEVGENLVDGLWDGIKSTWRGMLQKFTDLLDLLPDAAKKALGIASPSKVFMEIGEFTALGMVDGVQSENDNAQAAIEDLVAPPEPDPSVFSPITGGAGRSVSMRGGGSLSVGDVTITIQAGSASNPGDIGEEVERRMRALFAEWSAELGADDEEAAAAA